MKFLLHFAAWSFSSDIYREYSCAVTRLSPK